MRDRSDVKSGAHDCRGRGMERTEPQSGVARSTRRGRFRLGPDSGWALTDSTPTQPQRHVSRTNVATHDRPCEWSQKLKAPRPTSVVWMGSLAMPANVSASAMMAKTPPMMSVCVCSLPSSISTSFWQMAERNPVVSSSQMRYTYEPGPGTVSSKYVYSPPDAPLVFKGANVANDSRSSNALVPPFLRCTMKPALPVSSPVDQRSSTSSSLSTLDLSPPPAPSSAACGSMSIWSCLLAAADRALRSSRAFFASAIFSASTFIHGANSTPDDERIPRYTRWASADISS
mmetsp:Transcript_24837/g.66689  ORF Transcript_24837/g.66689 Transcript_24837/m.66689 type:complete len:287 (-) Transcript_24837:157-1017(-)